MTVTVKDPDTKQAAPASEQAAALERAFEAQVPAVAESSHKKQGAKQNGARQKDKKSCKVTTISVVVAVVAVIIALVAVPTARVGVSLQCLTLVAYATLAHQHCMAVATGSVASA